MAESRQKKLKETDSVPLDLLNLVAGHISPQYLQTIALGLGIGKVELDQIEYDFPTSMARCSIRRTFQVNIQAGHNCRQKTVMSFARKNSDINRT